MHRTLLIPLLLLFGLDLLSAIPFDPLHPPNTYRNADNPYYWKNKRPDRDYWQQDVHYRIRAKVDEKKDIIRGRMELTYWNNSPDTLQEAYFHLYQNAFQPGSYYDKMRNGNPSYGQHGSEGRGTIVDSIRVNGEKVRTELDNTILRVEFPEGLESGEKANFSMKFRTHFDAKGTWRRMDLFRTRDGFKHYNGVHWYPRISVYDRRSGWTTDQHLGKEFYGDFGTFDVKLNFPANFVVGATGKLQNRKEVMPDSLRETLDLSKFEDKAWNSPASTVIPYDSTERKTWHFYAENVHDFSFTADPTYRIDTVKWKGVTCKALVQEPHASGWTNAADLTARTVRTFSEDIGPYGHHKLIVADARSGMEYPMLTLCGGRDPGYRDLLVHEIGHQWFQGMVGTNETYRAAMDEGFTQFLTAHGLEALDGDTLVQNEPDGFYRKTFSEPRVARDQEVYMGYLLQAIQKEDAVLSTHSDQFDGYGKYRQVYYKMGTMLYNLQYVLGDSLYWDAMRHYFRQWRFAHPYFEDFKSSVIRRTGVDLNWFFDQWWDTKKRIDYAVDKVRHQEGDEYHIVLERKGEMQMPLDLRIVGKDSSIHDYYIPNTWFEKETDATVLDRWIGWGEDLQPSYSFTAEIPSGIEEVIIDPSGRLADVDRRDNRKGLSVDLSFDAGLGELPDKDNYELKWRPALWYNAIDGIKAGVHTKGDYMGYKGRHELSIWGNSGLFQQGEAPSELRSGFENLVDYDFEYRTGTEQLIEGSSFGLDSRWLDGLSRHSVEWELELPKLGDRISLGFTAMQRPRAEHLEYLLDESMWESRNPNRFFELFYTRDFSHQLGHGTLKGGLRTQAFSPDYDMSYAQVAMNERFFFGPLSLRYRLFGQYGIASNPPPESMLYLAGGNPESMMESPLARSKGFVPESYSGFGGSMRNFHYGGGLGLRGYSGYLAPTLDEEQDSSLTGHRGVTGASINMELEFQDATGIRWPAMAPYLDVASYLFMDAGLMDSNSEPGESHFNPIRMDAGLGAAITLKRLGPVEEIDPVTLRFDMPFFLNRTPAEDPEFFQYRWLVGIERAF